VSPKVASSDPWDDLCFGCHLKYASSGELYRRVTTCSQLGCADDRSIRVDVRLIESDRGEKAFQRVLLCRCSRSRLNPPRASLDTYERVRVGKRKCVISGFKLLKASPV